MSEIFELIAPNPDRVSAEYAQRLAERIDDDAARLAGRDATLDRRRPVEALTPAPRTRRYALTLTRREAVLLAAGVVGSSIVSSVVWVVTTIV